MDSREKGMFNLYMINLDQPWKKKILGSDLSYDDLIDDYGLSDDEIEAGLDDEVIRGNFILKCTPRFMEVMMDSEDEMDTMSDGGVRVYEIWMTGNPLSNATRHAVMAEIATQLGISCGRAKNILSEAMGKLRLSGRDRELIRVLEEYYDMLKRRGVREGVRV